MYKIGLKLKGFVCIDYILFPVRYMTCYPLQCYISMFVLIYRYLQLKKNTTTCTYMGKQIIDNAYLLLF